MKEVIISADGASKVYLVPDVVANDLNKYCIEFCDKWMKTSPNVKKYKMQGVYCFSEEDFNHYLNEDVFPKQKSIFVKNLGWTDLGSNLSDEYKEYPYFNF